MVSNNQSTLTNYGDLTMWLLPFPLSKYFIRLKISNAIVMLLKCQGQSKMDMSNFGNLALNLSYRVLNS